MTPNSESHGHPGADPTLHAPIPPEPDAIAEFKRREAELDPVISRSLTSLGAEAIEAYASVCLYHNTLSEFVPAIMHDGLRPDSDAAVPHPEDIAFAESLFRQKGYFYPDSQRQFERYIKGEVGDRKPGIFFYGQTADRPVEYNEGYGQPERLRIFASEMGYIMNYEQGPYTPDERAHARDLFTKYAHIVNGGDKGTVAVLQANPFSPAIFNERLKMLPGFRKEDAEFLVRALRVLGLGEFEGMHIPGVVPSNDLQVVKNDIPVLSTLREELLDPSKSRFYYTPPHMKRT